MSTNPFEVLRLDPASGEEEIVRQAGRLRQRATDESALNAIRQAVQALTARPEDRLLLAMLTHAGPCHQWPALDRFTALSRRPPIATGDTPPCPPLDREEFSSLVKSLAAEELELAVPSFEALSAGESPEEIHRQTAEALWQSLLFAPCA
jgi:hypothetical protein